MGLCRNVVDGFSKTNTEEYAKELAKYRKYKEGHLQCSLSELRHMQEKAEQNKMKLLKSDFLIVSNSDEDRLDDIVEDSIVKLGEIFTVNLFCSFETLAMHLKARKEYEFPKNEYNNAIGIAIHKSRVHIVSFEDTLKTILKFEDCGGERIEINLICDEGKITIR